MIGVNKTLMRFFFFENIIGHVKQVQWAADLDLV